MSTKKKVQKQMEFYLSVSNLRQDKFLQQQMQLHEEQYIPLDVFLSFNRMKAIGATKRILIEAIQKSNALVLNAEQTHVRAKELPDDTNDDSIERTVYIENFPCGSDHDSLRKLLTPFGKVNLVSIPRFPGTQKFKGFAFVEFADTQSVDKLLAALKAKNQPDNELHGMKGMAKKKWIQLRDSLKERISNPTAQNNSGTLKHAVEAASSGGVVDKSFFTRGLLIKLSNVPSTASRKKLKALLEEAAPVAFLDDGKLRFGGDVAFARFLSTSHTQRVLEFFKHSPLEIESTSIAIELVSGSEEEDYWTALVDLAKAGNSIDADNLSTSTQRPQAIGKTSHVHFDDKADTDDAVKTTQKTQAVKKTNHVYFEDNETDQPPVKKIKADQN